MRPVRPVSRVDAWSGVVFIILVVASSATVSLPLSSDPSGQISALYAEHRTAYVIAQVVGLIGVGVLLQFLVALRKYDETQSALITVAGMAVALAGVGTNVAVLVLCFDTGLGSVGVHRAAVGTDVTDNVLFVAYAALALALALSSLPQWLRALAVATALLCVLEAAGAWVALPGLDAAAPLAVLGVLLAVAIRTLRASRRPVAACSPSA